MVCEDNSNFPDNGSFLFALKYCLAIWNRSLVSSCANESQNQRNCLLSSHVIIQLSFNTAKQRYIYSKQTKKSENKDTVIKFLLSCNIRSLCNTAHCSERYVPTTGHRRQNTRINILINGSASAPQELLTSFALQTGKRSN